MTPEGLNELKSVDAALNQAVASLHGHADNTTIDRSCELLVKSYNEGKSGGSAYLQLNHNSNPTIFSTVTASFKQTSFGTL